jgi:hypothetical protein
VTSPARGNAGAHRIARKGDGVSHSRNHPLAQILSPESNATLAAALLNLAAAMGVLVGTDGVDVVTVAQSPVPLETGRWIHAELCKHKHAVIDIIAARTGASS